MANWNDLLNRMTSIATSYTSGIINPVTPVIATISNVSKINIPQTLRSVSTISRPTLSRISEIRNLPQINVIKTFPTIETLPSVALSIPGGLAVGASTALISPVLTWKSYITPSKSTPRIITIPGINTTQNRTIDTTQLRFGNMTPITNVTNTSLLTTQNTLPTISTIPTKLYKPSGGFMQLGTNKWGTATAVGTGYYKNTRVNNQVDYGTLYKTDKGAWYLVTPRGQVIQSGGVGSLSAMPKPQLRKQKYNRKKNSVKKAYGRIKQKSKIIRKKYRGGRK